MTLSAARPASVNVVRVLLIGAVLLFPFLAYFDTAASIVAIWDSSDTFAHGYVILPISLWLIWNRREQFGHLQPRPYWPALILIALLGMIWLLAEMGQVQVVRHYAFAAMLPLTALAILGMPIARQLTFPLLFILFAVPFGDVFIPSLIDITADFTVIALQATGIPVFREGNTFSIPSGNWSVVEACSGVRYLISSITLGSLYAYLTYRSPRRRALFVLMAIIVPIVANGLRAYMIVMIGHLSGMTMAVGVDHLIYGWLFFGLVMFLLFWIGSFWREDGKGADTVERVADAGADAGGAQPLPTARLATAALAIIAFVGAWPAYNYYLDTHRPASHAVELDTLQAGAARAAAFNDWKPAFPDAAAELQRYYSAGGGTVGLTVLYYRNPPDGTKLISTTNRMWGEKAKLWKERSTEVREEAFGSRTLRVRESQMASPAGKMLVWHWYWIDGTVTSSDYTGKLLQIAQKLRHSSDDGASIMVSAPYDENPEEARVPMRAFLQGDLGAVEAVLSANTRR